MGAWVATNDNFGAGGASPAGNGTDARTDGTQRAFTETLLKSVILGCWTNGGAPDWIILGGFNKQVFSGFDGVATKYQNVEGGKIIAGVDFYQSDFGMMKAIGNRFSRARDGWVLQSDLWAVPMVRNMFVKKLAATGDAEKRLLLTDFTLESRNESGSGLVADLETSP
jgi:hypothetical protein